MKKENETKAYLTFALGKEKFAIPVDHVQEVVELGPVTKVPHAPEYMMGIINLRGRVLPLLDTRQKLGLLKTEITQKSRVMVLDIQTEDDRSVQIGAIVDVAKEVIEIAPRDIQDAPEFENSKVSAPVTGLVNDQGDITLIMDITRVFSFGDVADLNKSLN
jgi:purine-binding chemotaxis protein CheW